MRVRVAELSDLPPGSSKAIHTDIGMVAVFNVDGRLHAIDDLCPHIRESLAQGMLDGCIVTCGGHGWRFDVRTGKSPDFDGIEVATFHAVVEDGVVWLELGALADDAMDWEDAADPDDIEEEIFD